eukprot:PhM_4_TR16444/c0_g1_i1/m.48089
MSIPIKVLYLLLVLATTITPQTKATPTSTPAGTISNTSTVTPSSAPTTSLIQTPIPTWVSMVGVGDTSSPPFSFHSAMLLDAAELFPAPSPLSSAIVSLDTRSPMSTLAAPPPPSSSSSSSPSCYDILTRSYRDQQITPLVYASLQQNNNVTRVDSMLYRASCDGSLNPFVLSGSTTAAEPRIINATHCKEDVGFVLSLGVLPAPPSGTCMAVRGSWAVACPLASPVFSCSVAFSGGRRLVVIDPNRRRVGFLHNASQMLSAMPELVEALRDEDYVQNKYAAISTDSALRALFIPTEVFPIKYLSEPADAFEALSIFHVQAVMLCDADLSRSAANSDTFSTRGAPAVFDAQTPCLGLPDEMMIGVEAWIGLDCSEVDMSSLHFSYPNILYTSTRVREMYSDVLHSTGSASTAASYSTFTSINTKPLRSTLCRVPEKVASNKLPTLQLSIQSPASSLSSSSTSTSSSSNDTTKTTKISIPLDDLVFSDESGHRYMCLQPTGNTYEYLNELDKVTRKTVSSLRVPPRIILGTMAMKSNVVVFDAQTARVWVRSTMSSSTSTTSASNACNARRTCKGSQTFNEVTNTCDDPKCSERFLSSLDEDSEECELSVSAWVCLFFVVIILMMLEVVLSAIEAKVMRRAKYLVIPNDASPAEGGAGPDGTTTTTNNNNNETAMTDLDAMYDVMHAAARAEQGTRPRQTGGHRNRGARRSGGGGGVHQNHRRQYQHQQQMGTISSAAAGAINS